MLAESVVAGYQGRVRFVSENYGDSELAKRFGVTRYPALFVDDILVATPNDFGFYGKGETETGGRYAPLQSAASHERLRKDLSVMIDRLLEGRKDLAAAQAFPAKSAEIASLPAIRATDLDGKMLDPSSLSNRVVVVELWATWCPPCRATLAWPGNLKKRYGDRLAVVTVAVESPEAGVRKVVREMNLPFTSILGNPDLVRSLGDVSAVPTLLMFDRSGHAAGVFYGAPPGLHDQAETRLAGLLP